MNHTLTNHLTHYGVTPTNGYATYEVPTAEIVDVCRLLAADASVELKSIVATDERTSAQEYRIYYIFGVRKEGIFLIPFIRIPERDTRFPSLTRYLHQANGYERKIHSLMGLVPIGHPDLRPFILHENWPTSVFPLRKDVPLSKRPPVNEQGVYTFQTVKGEGVYEIPVGPVHAGIIEPGHFRFSVAGEEILNLEPKLGYKHRGVEKLFESLPLSDKVRLSERVSGDTSFTHSLAFCQALESLAQCSIPKRAKYLRVIYSELERLANHINDIGFIMLDTGYSFGGSSGQRIRESLMQWHQRLCGNRYLRGINCIGGVTVDIAKDTQKALRVFLTSVETDFRQIITIASESSSVYNRLEGTGRLDKTTAMDHGVLGVAGRALNLPRDARKDYPYAAYSDLSFTISLQNGGDVRARFGVRVKEVYASIALIMQAISKLDRATGLCADRSTIFSKNTIGIGIAEGWRGDIVYTVFTDNHGTINRVDVRDPSFLIWPALATAGPGNVVPDFPLINKSFNLSYAGHDL